MRDIEFTELELHAIERELVHMRATITIQNIAVGLLTLALIVVCCVGCRP